MSPSRRCVDIPGTGGTHLRPRPVLSQCRAMCQIIPSWNRKPYCFALFHRLLPGCAIGCFLPKPVRCARLEVAGCCPKNNRGPRRVPLHRRSSSGLRYLAVGDWFAGSTGAHCRLNRGRCHLDHLARRLHASRGTIRNAEVASLSLSADHKGGTTARIPGLFRIKVFLEHFPAGQRTHHRDERREFQRKEGLLRYRTAYRQLLACGCRVRAFLPEIVGREGNAHLRTCLTARSARLLLADNRGDRYIRAASRPVHIRWKGCEPNRLAIPSKSHRGDTAPPAFD